MHVAIEFANVITKIISDRFGRKHLDCHQEILNHADTGREANLRSRYGCHWNRQSGNCAGDAKNSDAVNIAVLKKALDSQANAAVGLIQALPPVPSNPNVGRNVNTTA